MRGLATAGRTFESELTAGLESSVIRCQKTRLLIVPIADHSRTLAASFSIIIWAIRGGSVRHDCQRPTPAGELSGNRDVGDDRPFLTGIEAGPAGVQAPVGGLAPGPGRG
jgi:hypothetical protein